MSNLVKASEITGYLSSIRKGLDELVPEGIDTGGWLKTVQLLLNDNEGIQKALQSDSGQASLYHCLKFAAATGLSLNPQEGKAAIIAYGGKIQYQVMSKGMIDIAYRSGKVRTLMAEAVRENDHFTGIVKTMDGDTFEHTISKTDRGEIIGFYAGIKLQSGESYATYMTSDQIDDHKCKYAASKNGPWVTSWEGMAVKTVIKRLLRNVNLSPELTAAIGIDDKEEATTARPGPKFATAEVIKARLLERNDTDEPEENQTTETEPEHAELHLSPGTEGETD